MKPCFLTVLTIAVFNSFLFSQNDSLPVPALLNMNDGIFLTYQDFRYNKPIAKNQIVSNLNYDQLDFIGKTLKMESFSVQENANKTTINTKSVWGYIQNKTLYLNYKNDFYRVPVFGAVCYFLATVDVKGVVFPDPMFGPGGGGTYSTKELREFTLNFHEGVVREFNQAETEKILQSDKELYAEFKKLNKKNQREQISRYIRKFNDSHPVYFLK
jgi:hypothetical protein